MNTDECRQIAVDRIVSAAAKDDAAPNKEKAEALAEPAAKKTAKKAAAKAKTEAAPADDAKATPKEESATKSKSDEKAED